MRKSLLITYFFPPKIGGIENYLWNVCRRLPKDKIVVLFDRSGMTQTCLRRQVATQIDAEIKNQNLKVYQTNFFSWKYFKPSWLPLIWEIWRIIKKEKIEILQFGHYAHYCLIGILFKKLFKIPYLIYIHGLDFWIYQRGWFGRWLLKSNLKNADKIIANSYFMRNEILKLGIGEERVVVVHPGVNFSRFQIPDSRFQINSKFKIQNSKQDFDNYGILSPSTFSEKGAGLQDDIKSHTFVSAQAGSEKGAGFQDDIKNQDDIKGKKIILSLGRLIRLKGYDLVIRALPEVIKKVPNLIYLIAGEGEAERELKNLSKKLNLEKYVIFIGLIKDSEEARARYYSLADVFVGPSREIKYKNYQHVESFGMVYLEAAACGKPVIATKIGGIPEAVLDNQTGILIPPDDPQALSQALIRVLTDKDLAEKLGRQGRERVIREFSWEKQVGEIVKWLND